MLIIIIILLIVVIAFTFKIIKLRLVFKLQFNPDERSAVIGILLFSYQFLSYKFNLIKDEHFQINYYKKGKLIKVYTPKEIENKLINIFHQYKKSFDLIEHDVYKKFKYFFKKNKVAVESLNVRTDFGLQDAAATALTHGILLAIINALIGRFYDPKRKPKELCVDLIPVFHKAVFEINLNLIISMRLSSVAAIGGALVYLFVRNKILKKESTEKKNNKKNNSPLQS